MFRIIRAWIIGFRWRRFIREYDERIAEARRLHRPVNWLIQEKQDFVHACLRGEV
jgi:hypothetical protein